MPQMQFSVASTSSVQAVFSLTRFGFRRLRAHSIESCGEEVKRTALQMYFSDRCTLIVKQTLQCTVCDDGTN